MNSNTKKTEKITEAELKALPKVELHRHLELALRKSTILEIAPQHGFDMKKPGAYEHHFIIEEPMKDLGSVLHKFLDTQKLLSTPEILERVAYEACEDAHNEGVKILELRYAPTFVQLDHDLSFDDIHQAFVRGCNRAEKDFNMAVGLICILQRILGVEVANKVTDFAIANKDTFIGLDLADNEVGFEAKPYGPCFQKAKAAGLNITVHAGEALEPNSEKNVIVSIEELGASRIGHGIQIIRNEEVLKYVVDHGVVLEVCLKSNLLTSAITSYDKHPINALKDKGVKITVNSDDPGIFESSLLVEYRILEEHLGWTKRDFVEANEIAAKASFISDAKKQKVWPTTIN